MTHKEAARITDDHEGLLASIGAQEVQAHPATCNNRRIYSGRFRQQSTVLGNIPETSLFPATGKAEQLTVIGEQRRRRSRFMLTRPREIAAVAVRIMILVAIIWAVKIWIHGATPTQRYGEYTVDFSKQSALQQESLDARVPPAAIPRGRLDLVVYAGIGSRPGPYDVVLTRVGATYGTASGTMKIENGRPVLRVNLDLTQAPAGHYLLGIRPAGWEWQYYKVTLKSAHWLGH
ncbi:MAG TPA: hypothetical protein VNM47_11125 [Terriglobia bacterium]|nr:hypothetical protein [Terriglobia bacterium]